MERIRIELEPSEYSALVRLSDQELRPVTDQARHLIRLALLRRRLLARQTLAGLAGAERCTPKRQP